MSLISSVDFLKHGVNTIRHFGFKSVDELKNDPLCRECKKRVDDKTSAVDKRVDGLHGMLTGGAATYFGSRLNAIEGPVLFYTTETVPRTGDAALSLHIFGVEKSIAEALLIQTMRALANESGFPNHSVRINSLGDDDSVARYTRELTNYLRKRADVLPPAARELMKEHAFSALMHLIERDDELARKSPNSLEYLSDPSRKHFREIIEYLDMSQTPYEIDSSLIGHHQCYSDALFAFDLFDEESNKLKEQPLYIRGGRYGTFVKRMSGLTVPAVSAVAVLRDKKAPTHLPKMKIPTPSVFVVQLGFGPKIKSLLLINELREAGIPVFQNLTSDSLSGQLLEAAERNTRFALIVGQKEFIDDSVILRDLHAQSQESVPISGIVRRLQRVL
ncbi:hypothetical protein GW943_01075 [Candidatus Parcubacteria bacterium]|uniref:Histidyl-tRNA synthetase n=1 Tax=Candidatus Kaiserbacteria bacterium CG10_big_fil_rev_8_21_14_0_10_47_16 TaxID=1974608 RepID=A0A2H0UDD2_9BACT|nr:hypothetical protein [Candidatus Parcubacteria bacterium]PIR84419.1 MAG: hypothetical protein COU16_02455 [Candidatus Kaiserbacteria bacterium CG10_big_fil_rev_8_21_14_0_10_47_16]